MRPPLYCFLIDAGGQSGVAEMAAHVVERYGFDILDIIDVVAPYDSWVIEKSAGKLIGDAVLRCTHIVVAIDVCPLSMENERQDDKGDGRLSLIPYMVEWFHNPVSQEDAGVSVEKEPGTKYRIAVIRSEEVSRMVLRSVVGRRAQEYEVKSHHLAESVLCPFRVVRTLPGVRYNARADLVEYGSGVAVCKMFRPGRQDRFKRELAALQHLADFTEVPDVLDYGENWILMTYFEGDELSTSRYSGLYPLFWVKSAFEVAMQMHKAGLMHLDFQPTNIIIHPIEGVKIIDFESSVIFGGGDIPFNGTPLLSGLDTYRSLSVLQDHLNWLPYAYPHGTYVHRWKERVGVSSELLLSLPTWPLRVLRIGYVARVFARRSVSAVRQRLGRSTRLLSAVAANS